MLKVKKLGYSDRSNARAGYKAACAKTPALNLPHEVVEEDGRFFVRVATVDPEIAKAAQEAGLKVTGAALGSEQDAGSGDIVKLGNETVLLCNEGVAFKRPVYPIDEARAAEAALQEDEPPIVQAPTTGSSNTGLVEVAETPGMKRLRARANLSKLAESAVAEQEAALANASKERGATAWPVHKAYFAKRADSVGEAKVILGEAAKELTDFVVCKLEIAEPGGRKWYWVSMAQVEAEWSGRQRIDAGLAPKPRSEAKEAKAPKTPKEAKAPQTPRAQNGEKAPRPGTNAEAILRQLKSADGMTTKSIEAELKAMRGEDVKCSARATSIRFHERYGAGLKLDSAKGEDGAERFWIR